MIWYFSSTSGSALRLARELFGIDGATSVLQVAAQRVTGH